MYFLYICIIIPKLFNVYFVGAGFTTWRNELRYIGVEGRGTPFKHRSHLGDFLSYIKLNQIKTFICINWDYEIIIIVK